MVILKNEVSECETIGVYYEFMFFIRIDAFNIFMNNIFTYNFIGFI